MGEGNNHKIYTAEEIQSYLEGRMSAADMHSLERAALEDPFLADAIEGYRQTGINAIDSGEALKQALKDRLIESREDRVIPVWLKIAAAVAVLVTTVVSITLIIHPGSDNPVIVESRKMQETSDVADSGTRNQEPANTSNSFKDSSPVVRQGRKEQTSLQKQEANLSKPAAETKAEEPMADMAITEAAAPEKFMSAESFRSVNGMVIDSNKRPVPGAIVSVAKQQVVTNDSGLFALKPTDSVMNVQIQSVGFATRNAVVKDDAIVDTIILKPSTQSLEEVVVMGYGTKKQSRAQSRKANSTDAVASPSIPWEEYNDYINKNLQSSGFDTIPAEAVISFTVNSRGTLSKFKLDKPAPTKKMNDFLIDLIKTGPKWQVDSGNTARGHLRIELGRSN